MLFWAICAPILSNAQGNCNNPITLSSVVVSNTQCGASTGSIILTPAGGLGFYTFQWTPAVSITNVATGLAAGAYNIHIERLSNPNCTLDTLVIVSNSNGPQVQASISPAQCQANNGAISLTPTNFLYNWSNGSTGPTITGLMSKDFYVTVTNPNNGCFSILKYFVPRTLNSLTVNAVVQNEAKCGMNNGRAQIVVSGGSGQYSYTPSPGPLYQNLAPNNYFVQVLDLATGCTGNTNFSIQNLPVSGTVNIVTQDVRCSGQATGQVSFDVTPGANFALPYVFTLKDGSGNSYSPGSLPAGNYTLQILDADGCPLPPQNCTIQEPPPFLSQVQTTPENCNQGGSIALNVSGGNGGPYLVNWADLPADTDPEDRQNLSAGRYSATVYDTLFCAYPIDTVLIAPNCNRSETVHLVASVNANAIHCVKPPPGLAPSAITYSILGSGLSGSSAFGTWALSPAGCLTYSAGNTAGFAVDTICLIQAAPSIGLKDTTCVIVSIAQQVPSKQSVFFSVLTSASATACGTIPPSFTNPVVLQLDRPGLQGASGSYGNYQIDPNNACLAFFAQNIPGDNVDEIRVAVFNVATNRCHIMSYFPTIMEPTDCATAIALPNTLQLNINDCNDLAMACLPVPLDEIVDYAVLDNGALYTAGYTGCAQDSIVRYNLPALPLGGGPYTLTEWLVNGQILSGFFLNINGLVDLLNTLEGTAKVWRLQGLNNIRGGQMSTTYGSMKVQSATGNVSTYQPTKIQVPLGTSLRFASGLHEVILRNVSTNCADTVSIEVICTDCGPIHSYPLNGAGQVSFQISDCTADSTLCTNIPNALLGGYLITDNGQSFFNYGLCGSNVGMNLDTGFHELYFRNSSNGCEWTLPVQVVCKEVVSNEDIPISVPLDSTVTICPDISGIGNPVSISNICEDESGNLAGYTLNTPQWCVEIQGLSLGLDTLCIQVCDANGSCSNFYLHIEITAVASNNLLIFNGISPNGDGLNDVWQILGIEQYPNNRVLVFNRWGNQVFDQKGYQNAAAWSGEWNGKILPDGTYFYQIDLGDGSALLSGWLEILR